MVLNRILIKDSPSFKEAIFYPHKGFNVISGVSGSGKSVLMESILALFGFKDSNARLIECEISGISLEDYGILGDEDIVLSVVKKDKIKYFINNQSSSKKRIKEIFSHYLHYVHSSSTTELDDILYLFESYKDSYVDFISSKNELNKLVDDEKRVNELKELISFEINQIQSINPKIGEYENLIELKKDLSKREKMLGKISLAKCTVDGFANLISLLENIPNTSHYSEALREIDAIIRDEEDRLLLLEVDDIEGILNRIEILSKLIYKYGSIGESLEYLDRKKQELEYYENISFNKQKLESKLEKLSILLRDEAKEISKIRLKYLDFFKKFFDLYIQSE